MRTGLINPFKGAWTTSKRIVGAYVHIHRLIGSGFQEGYSVVFERIRQAHALRRENVAHLEALGDWRKWRGDKFEYILSLWGIPKESAKQVTRNLVVEGCVYTILSAVPVLNLIFSRNLYAALGQTHTGVIVAWITLVATPCLLLVAMTRFWRAWCIAESCFVPFRFWIIGRWD